MDSPSHEFVQDSVASDSKRARERDSLFLMARMQLEGDDEATDARIRNLSEGGLMAEVARVVSPGTKATLDIRGLGVVTGKVAWCTEGRVGIALDKPIDPKKARKPVGGGTLTPEYAKPFAR